VTVAYKMSGVQVSLLRFARLLKDLAYEPGAMKDGVK
jgi:hypothetical protein